MEENKSNLRFASSSALPAPTTPYFDQNPAPTSVWSIDRETAQLLKQSPMKANDMNHNSLLADQYNSYSDDFETTDHCSSSSTQSTLNNDNYNYNMYNPFIFPNPERTQFYSPSTLSTTHNNTNNYLSNHPIGYTGLLSNVVNFDSAKTSPPILVNKTIVSTTTTTTVVQLLEYQREQLQGFEHRGAQVHL
ncbi:unnamed protein product [Citrullus colocynthis]|uniref:Uncharacterized protein n=1 Tax=Citrullus colocynthis TaxID=252529 RepID=A0ABP0YWG5_9ROSI